MGSRWLRQVGIAGSLLAFLVATLVPRFGLVWHEHEEADHDHDHATPDLIKLLGVFHGEHESHVTPHATAVDTSQTALFDADTSMLHVHYVDDTLLAYSIPVLACSRTVLRLFLEPQCHRGWRLCHAVVLLARAPPAPLITAYV